MGNKTHISQIDDRVILTATDSDILAAGASLVSEVIYVSGYTHICGFVYSDVDSAASGLVIEQGLQESDFPSGVVATEHVTVSEFSVPGADIVNNAYSVQIVAPFVRIFYTNGAAPQTTLRMSFEARIIRGL